ncbi:MAG: universal stress protein [Methylocapsa sp.]|nr:universal stress protein [Methylocapsa sp.]
MAIKTVWLGLNFEDPPPSDPKQSYTGGRYAVELCAQEGAHLTAFLAAPVFKIPGVVPGMGLIPGFNAPADQVNAQRLALAEKTREAILNFAEQARVTADVKIEQDIYAKLQESLLASARPSDILVIRRPGNYRALDRPLIETVLFASGRPILLVPAGWARGAKLEKAVVAWDGSGRAARAVGDAIPLLARAGEVQVITVSSASAKAAPVAGLLAHLARHCKKVAIRDLPVRPEGIASTLRKHATEYGADLLVMGAYAHPRILETFVGGVTSDMLVGAELPIFLSH